MCLVCVLLAACSKGEVMNLLESAGFSRANPYYVVQQGKVGDAYATLELLGMHACPFATATGLLTPTAATKHQLPRLARLAAVQIQCCAQSQ
jgi:hypothetical protein